MDSRPMERHVCDSICMAKFYNPGTKIMSDKQPHKHAELFRELAEDGEAWRNWQWKAGGHYWVELTPEYHHLLFKECGVDFRRKPAPKEYILIGDIRVPAPCREDLEKGQRYWIANLTNTYSQEWMGTTSYMRLLNAGRIHLTREAAQAHVDAEKKVNTTVMIEE